MHPPIKIWNEDSIEAKAYKSVVDIPTVEFNDRNRLGYYVYLYLDGQYASLREAMRLAQSRVTIPLEDAYTTIRNNLRESGFDAA